MPQLRETAGPPSYTCIRAESLSLVCWRRGAGQQFGFVWGDGLVIMQRLEISLGQSGEQTYGTALRAQAAWRCTGSEFSRYSFLLWGASLISCSEGFRCLLCRSDGVEDFCHEDCSSVSHEGCIPVFPGGYTPGARTVAHGLLVACGSSKCSGGRGHLCHSRPACARLCVCLRQLKDGPSHLLLGRPSLGSAP
jgi:hypothetical protein